MHQTEADLLGMKQRGAGDEQRTHQEPGNDPADRAGHPNSRKLPGRIIKVMK